MKKIIILTICFLMLFNMLSISAYAAERDNGFLERSIKVVKSKYKNDISDKQVEEYMTILENAKTPQGLKVRGVFFVS